VIAVAIALVGLMVALMVFAYGVHRAIHPKA
jgi:hypothetical protein